MTETLCLAEDVFFCVAQGQGIFLDLKRDAYSAVGSSSGDATSGDSGGASNSVIAALIAPHRDKLLEAGLLTLHADGASRVADYLDIERPTAHIFGLNEQRAFGHAGEIAGGARVAAIDAIEFLLASRQASLSLKTRHISDIVHTVRRRKAATAGGPVDIETMRRQTAIFSRLRPWYPRNYLCLYDSLALLEFLARRRLYPEWIFGVQAQPFGAHCWLQSGGRLLNETTEYAGQFTPIMSV